MNIKAIGFVDVSTAMANLLVRHRAQVKPKGSPSAMTPLRGDSGDAQILSDWKSGKVLLDRLRLLLGTDGHLADFGRIGVLLVSAGCATEWAAANDAYSQAHDRFHICLVPSPGMMVFSGGESAVLHMGQIVFVNRRVLCSVANFHPTDGFHLVVDVVRPEVEE